MPPYAAEPEAASGRRSNWAAAFFVLAALVMTYLPARAQQGISWALRASVLRPFIVTQERLVRSRERAARLEELQHVVDSLTSAAGERSTLREENHTLRSLLELRERAGPSFRAASVLRPGTPGSESMFMVFLGARDGVRAGSPVVSRHGLVGVIREVREDASVGMDWTHPDFRASAVVADGGPVGIVEARRGRFREEDRLVLTGTPYHERIPDGSLVITSGLGGVFPRGIPIGRVRGLAEAEAQWRKSYWLEPMVHPGAVTHVLVQVADTATEPPQDLTSLWPDSTPTRLEALRRLRERDDRVQVLEDSVQLLLRRLEAGAAGRGR